MVRVRRILTMSFTEAEFMAISRFFIVKEIDRSLGLVVKKYILNEIDGKGLYNRRLKEYYELKQWLIANKPKPLPPSDAEQTEASENNQ